MLCDCVLEALRFEMMIAGETAMAERAVRVRWWTLMAVGLMALSGCNGFFVPENGSGSDSGGGSGGGGSASTSNLAYVANTLTNTVSGFAVGAGTLASVPNMPYAIGFTPLAAAVASNFLYVAGPGAIYPYAIGADGSLSTTSVGAGAVLVFALSMDVTPDGNWMVALDGINTQLDILAINKSTGALTLVGTVPYAVQNAQVLPKMVKVSPDGTLIYAALGTGGDVVFTFNTATGVATMNGTLAPVSAQTSDNAVAIDGTTKHLYIARSGVSGGLAAYTIGTGGALTSVAGSPFKAGAQPMSVVLDSTGTYAYVANGTDATISGYSLASGVATALTGSPYASGSNVRSLAIDKSGKYLLAAALGGSPDLTMYSFDATVVGKLNVVVTTATGVDPAGAIAVAATH
jgi:6-phosphogluconolactonase